MKLKDGFVLEEVGGAYLAVAVGDRAESVNALVRMNGSGAFLWRLLQEEDLTEEQLIEKMLSEYDVTREVAAADISVFIRNLAEGGLLDGQ